MSFRTKIIIAAVVIALAVYAIFAFDVPYQKLSADLAFLDAPAAGQAISSPAEISGRALGRMYFEAVFPVDVLAADQTTVIGSGQATAQTDWTAQGYVPFTAKISFKQGTSTRGYIRLKNDNPSGRPELEVSVSFPVAFGTSTNRI